MESLCERDFSVGGWSDGTSEQPANPRSRDRASIPNFVHTTVDCNYEFESEFVPYESALGCEEHCNLSNTTRRCSVVRVRTQEFLLESLSF
jgi:hypothetical protein